jgi:hypothetical protein
VHEVGRSPGGRDWPCGWSDWSLRLAESTLRGGRTTWQRRAIDQPASDRPASTV